MRYVITVTVPDDTELSTWELLERIPKNFDTYGVEQWELEDRAELPAYFDEAGRRVGSITVEAEKNLELDELYQGIVDVIDRVKLDEDSLDTDEYAGAILELVEKKKNSPIATIDELELELRQLKARAELAGGPLSMPASLLGTYIAQVRLTKKELEKKAARAEKKSSS